MIFIGIPGIEKLLACYSQCYSRIGFAHEFDRLSKDEIHNILEYKWEELRLFVQLKDFSNYEAITSIIKITSKIFGLSNESLLESKGYWKSITLKLITTEIVDSVRNTLIIGIK